MNESLPDAVTARGSAGSPVARRSALFGAMFLMATSAVGPGFITQTTTFTMQLGAAFAFAILASTLVDIAVQLNVWRVVGISGKRVHELAAELNPLCAVLLSLLIVVGGLVFNIGNVAGTGMGLEAATGVNVTAGAAASATIAVGIFIVKRAGAMLDRAVVFLGALMIAMTAYVAISSSPDVGPVLRNTMAPETVNFFAVTTLIGGTVGGYMTYAGAHRLLDSGISGVESSREISRSSITGVLITAVMRSLLFLAILGVVQSGVELGTGNPTATAFGAAAGDFGRHLFGVIFWAAAMTSVIGASFTSMTFLTRKDSSPRVATAFTVGFIMLSLVLFLLLGQAPVTLLIFAGAFNGLVLPLGFTVILYVAWRRRDLLRDYRYPTWLLLIGVASWLLTLYLGWNSIGGIVDLWRS